MPLCLTLVQPIDKQWTIGCATFNIFYTNSSEYDKWIKSLQQLKK